MPNQTDRKKKEIKKVGNVKATEAFACSGFKRSFPYLVSRHCIKIKDFNNALTDVATFRLFTGQLFRVGKIAITEME